MGRHLVQRLAGGLTPWPPRTPVMMQFFGVANQDGFKAAYDRVDERAEPAGPGIGAGEGRLIGMVRPETRYASVGEADIAF